MVMPTRGEKSGKIRKKTGKCCGLRIRDNETGIREGERESEIDRYQHNKAREIRSEYDPKKALIKFKKKKKNTKQRSKLFL